ncbi:MAG TPA: CerR family C-terminal domain-containing protein [Blastocatellia bacterium]|nr:CerR family C-terminal domain-containing protein [Blastocatellia bacterium]
MARPKTEDSEAKFKISAAAEELFAARGYAGTAIRDIASKAGVNGAMIHYYFRNKEGLYRSILESAASRVRVMLLETTGSDRSTRDRLARFVEAYSAYILSHPNLARILHRETLAGGTHLIKVAEKYAVTNYTILRETMAEGVRRRELRKIDLDLAPVSLMGMVVVFQLIRPIISVALGKLEYDERFIKRLSAHTVDLFLNGAAAAGCARQTNGAAKSAKKTARRRAKAVS